MLSNWIDRRSYIQIPFGVAKGTIFATEWFNWPVSAEINYERMMFIPRAGTLAYVVDTLGIDTLGIIDTSLSDTTIVYDTLYDTLPGTFTADSTRRTDSAFFALGTQIRYTVQLIHQSGHIDTVEQAIYNPSSNLWITPLTVHIVNAGYDADTVMLRVLGDLTNVPDYDSLVEFARETKLDTFPSLYDTTIAIGTGGGVVPPPDSCFYAVGPYPNPSAPIGDNVSILVHYCISGLTITAQVYNTYGSPVGSAVTYTSDGQVWDRLEIPAPSSAGAYFIHASVIGFSSVLGYTVY
jgi:hypothetical protein